METPQTTSTHLHRPGKLEMVSYLIQRLIVSVAISVTLETVARNYVAIVVPGDLGYVILVSVFAPVIEEFTKVFPLLFRHAETEKSIVKLGLLAGLGFGIAEFAVYVWVLGAPVAIRFPEMLFHASNAA
ncbi:MAG: PrsW family glutamic-type intramembrane protease, partial [Candidatus Bathyarchaeota archaeon]|nr:PrsW family glutamic-type intramembrane protease [Candidatus Bathyarchaeota archaeon]